MTRKITPDELTAKLKEIKRKHFLKKSDIETCHLEMDEMLCKTLASLGYVEAVNFYRTTPKYYG